MEKNLIKEKLSGPSNSFFENPKESKKNRSKFVIILLVVIGIVAAIVAMIMSFLAKNPRGEEENTVTTTTSSEATQTTTSSGNTTTTTADNKENSSENWKTYTNPTYGYSFRYPESAKIEEYSVKQCEGDGGGCYSVESPGDVVRIDIEDDSIFIFANTMEIESDAMSHHKSDQAERIIEFELGGEDAYAVLQYDGHFKDEILYWFASDYKYDQHDGATHLFLDSYFFQDGYNIQISLGYTPLVNINEREMEEFLLVLETLEF